MLQSRAITDDHDGDVVPFRPPDRADQFPPVAESDPRVPRERAHDAEHDCRIGDPQFGPHARPSVRHRVVRQRVLGPTRCRYAARCAEGQCPADEVRRPADEAGGVPAEDSLVQGEQWSQQWVERADPRSHGVAAADHVAAPPAESRPDQGEAAGEAGSFHDGQVVLSALEESEDLGERVELSSAVEREELDGVPGEQGAEAILFVRARALGGEGEDACAAG